MSNRVGFTRTVKTTPTIGTSAYASGDLIGPKLTFENACRQKSEGGDEGTGLIQSVVLTDLAKQDVSIDVIFFDTDPSNTTFTDNAPFDVADADLPNIIGVAQITTYADFNDNSVGWAANLELPFDLKSRSNSLYAAMVSRGSPTYAASDLTLRVGIMQD